MIMVYWTQPEIFYREERRLRPGVRGKRNRKRDGVESAAEDEAAVTEALVSLGEQPFRVGTCVSGSGKVVYSDEQR